MVHVLEALAILRDVAIIVGVGIAVGLYRTLLKAKKAEVDLLREKVSHLEMMSAPALASQVEKMAPLINRYATEIEELKEKQRSLSDASRAASEHTLAIGIAEGMLEAVLTLRGFTVRRATEAGLAGEGLPRDIEQLSDLLDTEIAPMAKEALGGKVPELKHLKKVVTMARRAALKSPDSKSS